MSRFTFKWQGMRESNSQQWFWRVELDQVSPFSSNRNGIITSSSISCKFILNCFGEEVNTLIDLSSPFLPLSTKGQKFAGFACKGEDGNSPYFY